MARGKAKRPEAADEGAQTPESAAVERWQSRLTAASDSSESRRAEAQRNREYARGTVHDDGKPGLVRTNLIQVNMSSVIPHTYAKNPEIAVSPTPAVTPERYKVVRDFSETLETVLQRMFVIDTKLKQRMRSNLYSVYTAGDGWLKMIYQRDYEEDSVVKARIQDSQDNLAELERQLRDMKDADRAASQEADKYELGRLIESLQERAEVVVAEGLVLDRVLSDDMLILDDTLFDFDYYSLADGLAMRVWMTKDEYSRKFGGWPEHGAPTLYTKPERSKKESVAESAPRKGEQRKSLVAVWEIWDKVAGDVKTLAAGAKRFARDPYTPENRPQRWYPFYRLGWNFVDGQVDPIPDVSLQRELQDEYNTTRTNFADHRKGSVPVLVVRTGGSLTQDDIDRIQSRRMNQIIGVTGNGNQPLAADLAEVKFPAIDPRVYDVSPIRTDMELVAGRGDADAGSVSQAKTATEAELLQQGMTSRSDYRRDVTEDLIQEMAQDAAEMLLQELTLPMVKQIAGEGAVWPEMTKDEVFNLVQIQIRAGSTSKPNKNKALEQWQQLLPLLMEQIQLVYSLRSQGQTELSSAIVKLMEETLKRFDERFDLEEFLGPQDEEGKRAQEQRTQIQQELEQLQAENEQLKGELSKVDQSKQAMAEATVELKREQVAGQVAKNERDAADAELQRQHEAQMQQAEQQHQMTMAHMDARLALIEQMLSVLTKHEQQPEPAEASDAEEPSYAAD